jgi:hypothetical protein
MQPLSSIAADCDHGNSGDADADRDAFQQRAPTVLVRRRLRPACLREARVNAGVYLLLDFLQEGRHDRVAVLGTQLTVGRGGGADLIGRQCRSTRADTFCLAFRDDPAPRGGIRLTCARHPATGRVLDLVVRHRIPQTGGFAGARHRQWSR